MLKNNELNELIIKYKLNCLGDFAFLRCFLVKPSTMTD